MKMNTYKDERLHDAPEVETEDPIDCETFLY